MRDDLLGKLTENFGSNYLSVLHGPKNLKNKTFLGKRIVLRNASDGVLTSLRDSLQKFFRERSENISVGLENESDISQDNNYPIDVGFFLENPSAY